jgi:hypothetical protein
VNAKMKNKAIRKFSPFALSILVCSYQAIQMPLVYGATLQSAAATDNPLLKPIVPELPQASAGCGLAPTSGSALPKSSVGSSLNASSSSGSASVASTSTLASTVTESVGPSTIVANAPALAPVPLVADSSANLVAQVPLADDCCEIGGTTTCEVGGLPPVGGGALAGLPLSPLLALLAAPLGLLPLLGGGGGDGGTIPTTPPPPVPEPSSTAAIAAGLGLLGLGYGRRRFRAVQKTSV